MAVLLPSGYVVVNGHVVAIVVEYLGSCCCNAVLLLLPERVCRWV